MKMTYAVQCLLLVYIAITSYALSVSQCKWKGAVMAYGSNNRCYLVRRAGRGYAGAKQGCNSLGGILATGLWDQATMQALASKIRSGYAYVGLEQRPGAETRRGWHFVNSRTGKKTGDHEFLPWDVSEPDDRNGRNERVAALSAASAKYHDVPSGITWDYICEFGESVLLFN